MSSAAHPLGRAWVGDSRKLIYFFSSLDGAGEIVEVGSDVQDFKVGDRVTVNIFQGYQKVSEAYDVAGNFDHEAERVFPSPETLARRVKTSHPST